MRKPYGLVAMVIAVVLMQLSSCGSDAAINRFRTLPEYGWETGDSLHFCMDSVGQTGTYSVSIGLRVSVNPPYPYRDITLLLSRETYLLADTLRPVDAASDTLVFALAGEHGTPKGRGVSLYQYDFPVDTVDLVAGTNVRFVLKHYMRHTPLPGIRDVGVVLRRL